MDRGASAVAPQQQGLVGLALLLGLVPVHEGVDV